MYVCMYVRILCIRHEARMNRIKINTKQTDRQTDKQTFDLAVTSTFDLKISTFCILKRGA